VVKGNVTLSLEDYHSLIDASSKTFELKDNLDLTVKELQVFLSFLCTRENLEKYVEEFNRQSKTSKIEVNNGIVKISLNNDK
tara:strand:- start:2439 stop:2684 length:246 start_codon:yes stop_codon:yes gene_type:complete